MASSNHHFTATNRSAGLVGLLTVSLACAPDAVSVGSTGSGSASAGHGSSLGGEPLGTTDALATGTTGDLDTTGGSTAHDAASTSTGDTEPGAAQYGGLVWAKNEGIRVPDDLGFDQGRLDVIAMPDGGFAVVSDCVGWLSIASVEGDVEFYCGPSYAGSSFVARYDGDGLAQWVRILAGAVETTEITRSPEGAIIIAGVMTDSSSGLEFLSSGVAVPATPSTRRAFVASFTNDGDLEWVTATPPAPSFWQTIDLQTRPSGELVLALRGRGTLVDAEGATLLSTESRQVLVALGPDGNFTAANTVGEGLGVAAIALPADGGVAWVGRFGAAEFADGTQISGGFSHDIFFARTHDEGALDWVAYPSTPAGFGNEEGHAVSPTGSGAFWTTGAIAGQADFGQGIEVASPTSSFSMYVAKYASDGSILAAAMPSAPPKSLHRSIGWGIESVGEGAVITGSFRGPMLWNEGTPTEVVVNSVGSSYDMFIAGFDSAGELVFAQSAGGTSKDVGARVAVLSDDSVLVMGTTGGDAVFGAGETEQTVLEHTAGGRQLFFAKYALTVRE